MPINQVSTLEYFPNQIFRDQNGPCPILSQAIGPAVGNNQVVIAGISGKLIRVVSGIFSANGAAATLAAFKSASGGTALGWVNAPANTAPSFPLIFNQAGWFNTINTGDGLYVDITVGQTLIGLNYIIYTP